MIAAELKTMTHGGLGGIQDANLHLDRADAALLLNVSPRSIASAKAVRESAIPEIAHALRQGQMAVSQAVLVARLPEPRQQQVAAEMHDGRSLSKVVLAASQERVEAIERASTARPLSALGRRFPVLYADPPWQFGLWSEGGMLKAAEMHISRDRREAGARYHGTRRGAVHVGRVGDVAGRARRGEGVGVRIQNLRRRDAYTGAEPSPQPQHFPSCYGSFSNERPPPNRPHHAAAPTICASWSGAKPASIKRQPICSDRRCRSGR